MFVGITFGDNRDVMSVLVNEPLFFCIKILTFLRIFNVQVIWFAQADVLRIRISWCIFCDNPYLN